MHRLAQSFNLPTIICSGIYANRPARVSHEAGPVTVRMFLRFYEDGTVVSCRSTGELNQLSAWFNRDHRLSTTSPYSITNGVVEFIGAGDYEFLEYKGKIVGRELELRWHDKKSGARGVDTFRWQEWQAEK